MTDGARSEGLLPLLFKNVEFGMKFGPVELKVTDRLVKAFSFSTDDYSAICDSKDSVKASILLPDLVRLLNDRFDPNSMLGLHAKEHYKVHSDVGIGETVIFEGSCVDRYVKRGKGYYIIEATARSKEDGRIILSHLSTELAEIDAVFEDTPPMSQHESKRIELEADPSLSPVRRASATLAVGTPVEALVKQIHQEQVAVFSNAGLHWKNIHTDIDVARKGGYETTLAQGLMQSIYAFELGSTFFGQAWQDGGTSAMTYLNPVFEGDCLTLNAAVSSVAEEDGATFIELAVWSENQEGQRTAVGTMRGRVSGAA